MSKLYKRSLYLQARDQIFDIIQSDTEFMDKLPSETELSERLGVSRNTVREAIKALESEGYVIARHGVGTFVIRDKDNIRTNIANLDSSTKIITSHGYTPGTHSVSTAIIPAVGPPARELKLCENDKIFYVERVRTADGRPVVYVEDYIPHEQGMDRKYLQEHYESLLDFLRSFGHDVSFSVCSISAVISSDIVIDKLMLKRPTALLKLTQTHHAASGQVVLYSDSYYDSSAFEFGVIRKATS